MVSLLAIIPLFVGMVWLGKYLDIQATAHQASRYTVWERTVYSQAEKSDVALLAEVRERFFEHPINGLSVTKTSRNPMAVWLDDGTLLGADGETSGEDWEASTTVTPTTANIRITDVTEFVLLQDTGSGRFNNNTLTTAEVTVPFSQHRPGSVNLDGSGEDSGYLYDQLSLSSRARILSGDWSAVSEDEFSNTTGAMAIGNLPIYEEWTGGVAVLDVLREIVSIFGLEDLNLVFTMVQDLEWALDVSTVAPTNQSTLLSDEALDTP